MTTRRASFTALLFAYAGMCLIWGSTWMAIKVGLRGAPPLTSIAVRMVIASLIVATIVALRRIPVPREARFVRLGVFLGFFHIVLPYSLVYYGEQRISSGLAAVLYATHPLFVVVMARFALGDPLTVTRLVGIAAGLAGVGVIFSNGLSVGAAEAAGTLCVMGSVMASAIGSVATKRWSYGYHPIASLLIPFSVATVVTAFLAVLVERANPLHFSAPTWGSIVYLAAIGSVTAFALFFYALQHIDVTIVSYQTFIIPVIAIVLGWLFLDETISPRVALGGVLILGGLMLATLYAPAARAAGARARAKRIDRGAGV